ncbi:MAG: DNA phosphorothioation-dependent restriction protein DptF, partial [Methanobrevibacter wolinii]
EVCKLEGYNYLINENILIMVKELFKKNIISKEVYDTVKYFDEFINLRCYKGMVQKQHKAEEFKNSLLLIIKWFYNKYGNKTSGEEFNFNKPFSHLNKIPNNKVSFNDPFNYLNSNNNIKEHNSNFSLYNKNNDKINLKKNNLDKDINSNLSLEEENLNRNIDNKLTFKENNESNNKVNSDDNLLKELSKLKDSSKEAVESNDNFDDFKEYMHVNRSIQNDFIKELERVQDEDSNHLIILCGSVGDGKSHLLAYLKTKKPDLYNKFTIHNDATESFDPNKSAIDTLAQVLKPFNDENFNVKNDKVILAINLGVLSKFLESKYCANEFTKLRDIINESNILEKTISKNISQDKVSFITFSDYNLFELNDDVDSNYTSSKYISALFKKVSEKTENNPFYIAYKKDKEENVKNPIIYNYEMFSDEEVQDIIINYLIKIFIKYKKIVSTRELLNFIYEIIVPSEISNDNDFNVNEFKYLLPNLLFNNLEQSDLLKFFNEIDPINIRNEELDKLIVDFNIKKNIVEVLNKYFNVNKIEFLIPYLNKLNLNDMRKREKEEIFNILIHFAIFYGKSTLKESFKDENYLEFLKFLYYYNIRNPKLYKNLFNYVKESIFKSKGVYKKNYICIDELNSFKVFKNLQLKNKHDDIGDLLEGLTLGNRFKTSIKIGFTVKPNDNMIPLEIDYRLYEYIRKINHGFKPNKLEKEDLTIYNEFIDNLLNEDSDSDLIIESLDTDKIFDFEYDDEMNTFTFSEE